MYMYVYDSLQEDIHVQYIQTTKILTARWRDWKLKCATPNSLIYMYVPVSVWGQVAAAPPSLQLSLPPCRERERERERTHHNIRTSDHTKRTGTRQILYQSGKF